MQDYVNDQSKTVIIKSGKITAKLLAKALQHVLHELKRGDAHRTSSSVYKGKQSVKKLVGQGTGVSNIEITDQNIRAFEPIARKYGIDYALKKDDSESPPKWLVFFKSRDADALTAAFKEFTAKQLKRGRQSKPSVLGELKKAKVLIAKLVTDRVKLKEQGIER